MARVRAFSKYLLVIIALISQSQVFALETSTTPDMSNLKDFGLDRRVKVLGALVLIFAPLGLFAYNKNKQGSTGKSTKISVIEKKTLDQNSSILLVEIQGSTLLLGKTSNSINLIKELTNSIGTEISEQSSPATLTNVSLVSNS